MNKIYIWGLHISAPHVYLLLAIVAKTTDIAIQTSEFLNLKAPLEAQCGNLVPPPIMTSNIVVFISQFYVT